MTRTTILVWMILSLATISHTEQQQINDEKQQQLEVKTDNKESSLKALSRKKRFLLFPTGSSVSVATCMTVGVYGNPQFSIWSWAVNYGFAYNLPTNSSEFLHPPPDIMTFPFYHADDDEKKIETTTTTTEAPEIHSSEIHSSEIHSNEIHDYHDHEHDHSDHPESTNRRNFYVYRQPPTYETQPMIHRRYRRDIYRNIETVIDKMGYNGRDCILQALCESSTMFEKKKRRTMVQELIKTVFSMPKSKVLPFEHPELLLYDEAYRNGRNEMKCEKTYKKCNFSLIKLILGKYSQMPQTSFM